ncbi:MAG: LamG domain-containing protein [Thermoanaerobaculia bacterium]
MRRLSLGATVFAAAFAFLSNPASAQPFGAWETFSGPTSGYVEVPSAADLNPSTSITIEAWVAVTDANGGTSCSSIVGKDYIQSYWVGLCGNQLRSYFRGSASSYTVGTLDSGWHHIAAVFDGVAHVHCHFIDGVLVGVNPETGAPTASSAALRIGSDVSWPHTPSGSIDEVRIWSVARTTAEIRSTINVPIHAAQPGLVGVWSFDGGVGDVVGGHGGTVGGSGVFPFTFPVVLSCGAGSPTAPCLDGRFSVSVTWRTDDGSTGQGTAVECASDDSAIFWFFDPANWELLVKAHNACVDPFNRWWLFSAATTNVFYRLDVLDVRAGVNKIYFNYSGPPAPAVTDTDAFATCP